MAHLREWVLFTARPLGHDWCAMRFRVPLRIFAVLFMLLAVSNFLKPLQWNQEVGFVLLGRRLSGTANLIAGPAFGLYLALYAAAIWRDKSYALRMGAAYAAYVPANLILFTLRMPSPAQPNALFTVAYAVIAIGVSAGAVVLLRADRAHLT